MEFFNTLKDIAFALDCVVTALFLIGAANTIYLAIRMPNALGYGMLGGIKEFRKLGGVKDITIGTLHLIVLPISFITAVLFIIMIAVWYAAVKNKLDPEVVELVRKA